MTFIMAEKFHTPWGWAFPCTSEANFRKEGYKVPSGSFYAIPPAMVSDEFKRKKEQLFVWGVKGRRGGSKKSGSNPEIEIQPILPEVLYGTDIPIAEMVPFEGRIINEIGGVPVVFCGFVDIDEVPDHMQPYITHFHLFEFKDMITGKVLYTIKGSPPLPFIIVLVAIVATAIIAFPLFGYLTEWVKTRAVEEAAALEKHKMDMLMRSMEEVEKREWDCDGDGVPDIATIRYRNGKVVNVQIGPFAPQAQERCKAKLGVVEAGVPVDDWLAEQERLRKLSETIISIVVPIGVIAVVGVIAYFIITKVVAPAIKPPPAPPPP